MNSQLRFLRIPKHWGFGLFVILFAEMISLIGFISVSTIVPFYIQTQFGIVHPDRLKIWNGLLIGIPTLMLAIFAPLWGSIADRRGKKIMLSRAMLGGAVSIGLMFFAKNIYQFFLIRILQGITTGSIAAANVFLLSVVPPKRSVISLALLQISVHIGMAMGPLLGGRVFDILGGQSNFLISSFILFIAAILVTFLTKEPQTTQLKEVITFRGKMNFFNFDLLKNNPTIRFLVSVMFFFQLSVSLVSTQLALFVAELNKNFQTVGSAVGLLLTYRSIAACLGALFFANLSRKTTLYTSLFVSLSGIVLCYIPQAFSPNLHFLYIFSTLGGLFNGGSTPIFYAIINSLAPEGQRGTIFGISSSLGLIGSAIGPLIASMLAIAFGSWGNRSVFIAGSILLATVVFFAVKKTFKLTVTYQPLQNTKNSRHPKS